MRKIVIFAMILTFIFTLVGCTAHNEPDKKAVESSSTNAVIDTTQVEKLSEKAEGRTVEKSTFLEETTHSPAAETSTEKVSKEPIFSQTTTANTEPKQDTHTQTEPPKSEKSEPEITTNTVSEVTTAVEQGEKFDISYWISYAQNYAQSIVKLKKMTVPMPPMSIQNEFADFVKLIDKSKFVGYFTLNIFYVKSSSSTIAYSRVVSIFACPNRC